MQVYVIVNRELYGQTKIVGVFATLAAAEARLQLLNDSEDFWDDNIYSIELYEVEGL